MKPFDRRATYVAAVSLSLLSTTISGCSGQSSSFGGSSGRRNAAAQNPAVPTPPANPPSPNTDAMFDTLTKVGISFEDGGTVGQGTDKDFNDAVLCFSGKFTVNMTKRSVVSNLDQTVVATFSRRAACKNYMRINALDPQGQTTFAKDVTTADGTEAQISIEFKKGDTLKVFLLAGAGCNNAGKTIGLDDPDWAAVAPDACRTSDGAQ